MTENKCHTIPPRGVVSVYINRVKQMNDMDPCTIALETDNQLMEIHDSWMNDESIEEYLREEEYNLKCDEFAQNDFTV